MLNTYIKNRGFSKTIIHDSSNPYKNNQINAVNEINWDADYDGDIANISLTSNTNGDKKIFNVSLDNNDLENIFNIPSVDMPIHKRLKIDFSKPVYKHNPEIYKVELPEVDLPEVDLPEVEEKHSDKINTLQQILDSAEPHKRYLSTPLPNEELIIPLSINKKITPRRRHRHRKTHKTYRVYKQHKKSSRKSTRKSSRKSSRPLTFF